MTPHSPSIPYYRVAWIKDGDLHSHFTQDQKAAEGRYEVLRKKRIPAYLGVNTDKPRQIAVCNGFGNALALISLKGGKEVKE